MKRPVNSVEAVVEGLTADLLLRAVQATLTDAAQARAPVHERTLFDAPDQCCGGQLADCLGALAQQARGDRSAPVAGGT